MSAEVVPDSVSSVGGSGVDPRRWRALVVLCLVQFIQVVDVTVVNVALPRIQADLGFSPSGLAWVVNAYVLMAGGFLLLGGRLADLYGRRRLFLTGVAVFAAASAVCGAAATPGMLVSGRFVQGLGEALAAPAALGLIAMIFPHPQERIKAIGIWGGVAGLAGVSGVVISGLLTDLASWRWIFFINIPIALFALISLPRLVTESTATHPHGRPRLDLTGAITATTGLTSLVYGLLQAADHPWTTPGVWLPATTGLLLLAATILIEANTPDPLIPLRFFTNRTRATANLLGLLFLAAFISYFFLLTLFQQQILHYTPLQGGLAYLPYGLIMGIGIGIGTSTMTKLGVKPLLVTGFLTAAAGLTLTTLSLTPHTHYPTGILPGMLLFGLASGLIVPAIANAALHQVTGQDASLGSGIQQAVQQLGSALGLAILVTLALRYTHTHTPPTTTPTPQTLTHAYTLALTTSTTIMIICAALAALLLQPTTNQPRNPLMEQPAAA